MFTNTEQKTIGVIAAMRSEIEAIKAMIPNAESVTVSGIEYVYGALGEKNIVAAQCGIGKVFAAICAQTMILTFKPDLVFNIGVAGALSAGLEIGDIAIAESVVQHDMDTTPIGDPLGLVSGINKIYFPCDAESVARLEACADSLGLHRETGVIASGDCFVSDRAKKERILRHFNAISCEMEGAAVGHVCYVNDTPFCVVRAISDSGDENAQNDYAVSLEKAAAAAQQMLESYLKTC